MFSCVLKTNASKRSSNALTVQMREMTKNIKKYLKVYKHEFQGF